MKTLVFQQNCTMNFLYSLLSFGVRNYAHLTKNAFKLFASLRRYTTANGKYLYAEKPVGLLASLKEKKR